MMKKKRYQAKKWKICSIESEETCEKADGEKKKK